MNLISSEVSEESGCGHGGQDGFVKYINMQEGHVYALLVNNFDRGNNGFTIEFGGKVSITGKSRSTLNSYSTHLAKLALHFGCLPTELDTDQINDYLYLVQQQHPTASDSYFKFTVYGLRFAFRMMGLKDKHIELPSIKHEKKLPLILSREEVKRLLKAPKLLKHRILIGLPYGCGLRCFEARNVRIADLDFDRQTLHVQKGKGKKLVFFPHHTLTVKH